MADGGLAVLDGSSLKAVDPRLPETDEPFTGIQVLEIAESQLSSFLFGISLPQNLKSAALKRINLDIGSFPDKELNREQASSKLKDYVIAIASELRDDPLVVSVLDGSPLKLFLEDEDDFAMLAENLFTDLDTEDKGKICTNQIRNALDRMGVEMGVPPFSVFPRLEDILKKNKAEGEEALGQAQFAQLLQNVLQELADVLAEKHVVVIQNIKIINGSKLKKFITDEKTLDDEIGKIFQNQCASGEGRTSAEIIRSYLEKNGPNLGLPPSEANEAVGLLYDQVFADVEEGKNTKKIDKDEFGGIVKDILEKFVEQLEANPVFHELDG
ncbi:uncharacterized protein LOC122089969 [Macadamia integrifolia]|uniref:uncharacterized protein LOC122089969 n=1 Tax=Macadamia integrifolia TaxID=60698 RepID=UPI001C4E8E18|nr:uncharacterized protein LOC122089969 [Macadamia integrifolia]